MNRASSDSVNPVFMLLPFVVSVGVSLLNYLFLWFTSQLAATHCLPLCYSCHIFADILEKQGFRLSDGCSFVLFIVRVSLEVVFSFRFDTSLPF
jgi:hypothetical protein